MGRPDTIFARPVQRTVAAGAIVLGALQRHGWNKTRSARSLGITRQGLIKMMHRLGVPLEEPG